MLFSDFFVRFGWVFVTSLVSYSVTGSSDIRQPDIRQNDNTALRQQLSQYCLQDVSLKAALQQLSNLHNVPIIARASDIADFQISDVVCHYELLPALKQVLAGTPLAFHQTAAGITLFVDDQKLANTSAPSDTEIDLPIEKIDVVSYRDRYLSGVAYKHHSDEIADYISIGDMNRLPVINVADLVVMLPNVNITREAGHGTTISVRGLPDDFNLIELNGISVGAGIGSSLDSRGQRNPKRTLDLSLIPIEFLTQIEVMKSYRASLSEGGLAGNVNLTTLAPTLNSDSAFTVSARVGGTTFASNGSHGLFTDWSQGGEQFGLRIAALKSELNIQEQGVNTTRWRHITDDRQDIALLPEDVQQLWRDNNIAVPRLNRYSVWNKTSDQMSWLMSAVYESDSLQLKSSLIRSDVHELRTENHISSGGLQLAPFNADSTILAAQVNDYNELVYIEAQDVNLGIESRLQEVNIDTTLVTLDAQWFLNNDWRFFGLLGQARTNQQVPVDDKFFLRSQADILVDFRQQAFHPRLEFALPTTDLSFWQSNYFERNNFYTSNHLQRARFGAEVRLFDEVYLSAGWGYQKTEYDHQNPRSRNVFRNEWADSPPILPEMFTSTFTQHQQLDWIGVNVPLVRDYFGLPDIAHQQVSRNESASALSETLRNAYGELSASFDVLDKPATVHFGHRLVWVDLSSPTSGRGELVDISRSQRYGLTTLVSTLNLSDRWILRGAINNNVTLPGIESLAVGVSIREDEFSITGPNPNLKPYRSTNMDLALEYYWQNDSVLSLGVFRKLIRDVISRSVEESVYSDFNLPVSLLSDPELADQRFSFFTNSNLENTTIEGIELFFQSDWGSVDPDLLGLGSVISLSVNSDGMLDYYNSTGVFHGRLSVADYSRKSASVQLYYEQDSWGVRVAGNYRSEYVSDVDTGTLRDELQRGFLSSFYVDVSSYYHVNEQLGFNVELLNVTNEPLYQYTDNPRRLYGSTRSGRALYATAQYRF